MFCSSCGKKITENSKFCKHCGSSQTEKEGNVKKKKKKEYVTVWTCDFCGEEYKTKEESDAHEVYCDSNPKKRKRFFKNNSQRAWFYLWVITLLVFVASITINNSFDEYGINLFNNNNLSGLFLFNILVGISAFLRMVIHSFKKINKISFFTSKILIISIIYFLINTSVFAFEGYKVKNNEEYKKKYYIDTTTVSGPTPIPQESKDKLLKDLNNYRLEKKLSVLTLDDEMCKVAERLIKKINLSEFDFNKSEYLDLCPDCNGAGYTYTENISPDNVLTELIKSEENKKILNINNLKYACFAISNQRVLLFIGNKNSSSTTTNTAVTNKSNTIECIGPDGKHFNTTMDECKKLADSWGKPLDYMTDCSIHPDCGGGTVRISYSQCMKPCSGLSQKSNNSNQSNVNNSSTNTSNKVPVFLSYGSYTKYCPPQNVDAVKSIDSTMTSKGMDWAKDFNDCADNFYNTDNCYVSCANGELDNYGECIKSCPSVSEHCDYVYWERKSLTSQINTLCN